MNKREIDALVAQAKGIEISWNGGNPQRFVKLASYSGKDTWACHPVWEDVDHYSTSIEAAMSLFPVAHEHGIYLVVMDEGIYGYSVDAYHRACDDCGAMHSFDDAYQVVRTFEEVPEAICLAFLKAQGVEVEG